jgi:hypothetical protein
MARDFDGSWILCLAKKKLLEGVGDPYCINCFHDQPSSLPGCLKTRQECIAGNCVTSVEQVIDWRDKALAPERVEEECLPEDEDGGVAIGRATTSVRLDEAGDPVTNSPSGNPLPVDVSSAGGSSSVNSSSAVPDEDVKKKTKKKGAKTDDV